MARWTSRHRLLTLLWGSSAIGCGLFDQPGLPQEAPAHGEQAGASGTSPGAAGTNAAGGAWVSPVEPSVSQRWSWEECGRIAPDRSDPQRNSGLVPIQSLAISDDGEFLLSKGDSAIGWRLASDFAASEPLWVLHVGDGTVNVAISGDGRLGTASGDLRLVFDAQTGTQLDGDYFSPPEVNGDPCVGSEFNFSPDGLLVAGKNYTNLVDVFDTRRNQRVGRFATRGCAQGIAFSADGRTISAPDGSAAIANLQLDATASLPPGHPGLEAWSSLTRAPDGSMLAVRCDEQGCNSGHLSWSGGGGRHLSVSAEGQWLALGGKLLHIPSGEQRTFDAMANEAIFTPNGDLIAGDRDESLVRFCRRDASH